MNEQSGGTYTDGADELREEIPDLLDGGTAFRRTHRRGGADRGDAEDHGPAGLSALRQGIIDLRGSIIPLVDVRLRLGKPEREYDERTCIIVINVGERLFGLIVDEVDEVSTIPADRVSQPPKLGGDGTTPYLTGIARLGRTARSGSYCVWTPRRSWERESWMPCSRAAQ